MSLASGCLAVVCVPLLPRGARPLYILFVIVCLWPSLVLCQALPVITAVSGCTDVGTVTYNCTSGVTLTVYGTNFVQDDNANVDFRPRGSTVCWINQPIYPTNLTCNLFTDDRSFLQGDVLESVYINFPSITLEGSIYSYDTPLFAGVAFKHIPLPSIIGISGCDDTNNTNGQFTANCVPETATITLIETISACSSTPICRGTSFHQHRRTEHRSRLVATDWHHYDRDTALADI